MLENSSAMEEFVEDDAAFMQHKRHVRGRYQYSDEDQDPAHRSNMANENKIGEAVSLPLCRQISVPFCSTSTAQSIERNDVRKPQM
jgi:hypothetical protein